jgi:hypothetical protein
MKNDTDKRIRVYLESLGENANYERLFRALSLILSEEDLMKYLSSNQNNTLSSSLDERNEKSKVLVEKGCQFLDFVLSFKEDIKSMKRVAIYARVSTEKQEKEKTIDSQIEELRKFCEKNGFLIVKEYVDDGWILVCAKMLLTLLKLLEL